MGTWESIKCDDVFKDTYQDFIDLFNENKTIREITSKLIIDYKVVIDDPEMSNNFWFALAKAQWDYGELKKSLLNKVEEIIKSGNDIKIWKNLGAAEEFINNRKDALNDFLLLLKSENKNLKKPRENVK